MDTLTLIIISILTVISLHEDVRWSFFFF